MKGVIVGRTEFRILEEGESFLERALDGKCVAISIPSPLGNINTFLACPSSDELVSVLKSEEVLARQMWHHGGIVRITPPVSHKVRKLGRGLKERGCPRWTALSGDDWGVSGDIARFTHTENYEVWVVLTPFFRIAEMVSEAVGVREVTSVISLRQATVAESVTRINRYAFLR
ncbi:hypothetical protein A3A21_04255 [Candidatus Jorgensenbacteria bacterium RIFCSPLOWO2_01_FULL_45_25b]|uniref:Uncharacterized protein n=2 Tax=Parcubacteria group TaxID=1794811 RepID=A0A1F6BWM1_9BACT|nr:MAG: hypothetical protein A3A21_04255 [Candidatus Jorgensenbacteria bacterium RIFCSPLOWO2_01_FULL_45_25b]OHA66366.1 MAG: hypothetical protein A2672_00715 [Candidatus Wildermuthbacteria bacterium RIFCSPHIGHO2_01_FULL_49_22b]